MRTDIGYNRITGFGHSAAVSLTVALTQGLCGPQADNFPGRVWNQASKLVDDVKVAAKEGGRDLKHGAGAAKDEAKSVSTVVNCRQCSLIISPVAFILIVSQTILMISHAVRSGSSEDVEDTKSNNCVKKSCHPRHRSRA